LVGDRVERATSPLIARIADLEHRLAELEDAPTAP